MIDRDALARAIVAHKVEGLDTGMEDLAVLLDRVIVAQSKAVPAGIEDIVGEAGLIFEGIKLKARTVLRSCVLVAQGAFDAPEVIADFDPMVGAAATGLIVPDGKSADYSTDVADAARRVAARIADALAGAAADDLRLLAAARPYSEPGRLPKDLQLLRRVVRAAYHFAENHGLDMGRSWSEGDTLTPSGNLSRLAMACLEAIQPNSDPKSVRAELTAFRQSLNGETEAKGIFEHRKTNEDDFLFGGIHEKFFEPVENSNNNT